MESQPPSLALNLPDALERAACIVSQPELSEPRAAEWGSIHTAQQHCSKEGLWFLITPSREAFLVMREKYSTTCLCNVLICGVGVGGTRMIYDS